MLNDDHSQPAPFLLAQDFPVTTIGECSFTDNITSFIFPYDPKMIQLGVDTAICDNTTITLDATGNDLITWQWADNNVSSTRTVPAPGMYALTVTDICGITQTDQITISVDSSTVVSIGPDQVTCAGESISLSESGFDFYQWGPTTSVNCVNCANVSALPSSSGIITLQAGFNNGCVNRDTLFITVRDTFFRTIDTTICYGRTVEWINTTIEPNEQKTFFLQTIHGCDSTVLVRVQGTTVGTFQVQVDTSVCLGESLSFIGDQLVAGDQKTYFLSAITGCDSTVYISVAPKDTFSTQESRILCDGESTIIFGQPIQTSGIYRATVKAINGCDSTHTVNLLVREAIGLSLQTETSCFGEATGVIQVQVNNNAPPFDYSWNFTAQNSAVIEDIPAGNYSLTVTNVYDCTQTIQGTVSAYPPIIYSVSADSVRCFGESNGAIHITTLDTTLVFSLNHNDYLQQLEWPGLAAAPYFVYAQDIYGCVDTLPAPVLQPPPVVVDLPPSTTVSLGDSIILNVFVSGLPPLSYQWNTTQYLDCDDCPEPIVKPLDHINYALTISDANGCSTSDSMRIEVARIISYYIPNIFRATNGGAENSFNEALRPSFGPAVKSVRLFQVFDRWGSLQHESKNAYPDDKNLIWDGTQGGKAVVPGVYVWLLELELVDGYLVKYKGDVTVIR